MMEKDCTSGGIAFDVKIPAGTAARPSTAKRLEGRKRRLTKEELEEKMKGVEQRREVGPLVSSVHIVLILYCLWTQFPCIGTHESSS